MQKPNELSLHISAFCQDMLIQNDSCSTFHSRPPAYVYSGNIKSIILLPIYTAFVDRLLSYVTYFLNNTVIISFANFYAVVLAT